MKIPASAAPYILCRMVNGRPPDGNGFLHPDAMKVLRVEEAKILMDGSKDVYLDYFLGRVVKTEFKFRDGELILSGLYDRDRGPGALDRIVLEVLTTPGLEF